MAILFLVIVASLFLGAAVLYAMNLHWWRLSLIAGVLFGAVAMLWVPGEYDPSTRLKGGIDLVGGTRLVYDVVVPEGRPATEVIEDTIAILSDRVDPTGTRNLVWREVAGQRIQVEMALPPSNVMEARNAFEDAKKALSSGNLTPGQLDKAITAEDRAAQLDTLARGNAALRARLDELAGKYDDLQQARARYERAERQWDAIPREARDQNQDVYQAFLEAEDFYFDAKDGFERLESDILRENSFNTAEFDFLQDIPPVTLTKQKIDAGEKTPRELRLEKLKEDYPSRAEQIQAAYDALIAYEGVKGPLDGPEDLIALLRGSGVLEFRIAANPQQVNVLTPYLTRIDQEGPRAGIDLEYRWFEIDDLDQYVDDEDERAEVLDWLNDSLSVDPAVQQDAREQITSYFVGSHRVIARPYAGRVYLLLHNSEGFAMTRADDWAVSGVGTTSDELGKPAVKFELDGKGADLMTRMTTPNVERPMAVLLDDKVLTSPNIQTALRDQVRITGDFSMADVKYIVDTMRAGSLEGQLSENPVSQQTIGSTLGADNIRAGLEAAIVSLVLVAIFMAVYYFFSGMVANFALAANMVLILGVMAMVQSTFTLPGIAGLVLTIGMAVDANVLIFERIREELVDRKVSIEIAVRQGYGKALSTILDANITTLITCLILGYTASSEVKGFAVVLGIGILATLFTALFCTKVLTDLYVRYRKPKTLLMLPTAVPALHRLLSPNVDWIGKAKYLVPISAILLVAGFLEAYSRGADLLDIEFRSGTSVGFTLKPSDEPDANGDPVLTTLEIGKARERIGEVADAAARAQDAREAGEAFSAADDRERQVAKIVEEAYDRYAAKLADYEEVAAAGGRMEEPDSVPDFELLKDAQVIVTGESDGITASGFSVATLVTDSQAVTGLLKIAFEDVLETTRPVSFEASDLSAGEARGVVEQIDAPTLNGVFNGIGGDTGATDLAEYRGGVALYIQGMTPALSTQELEARIQRMRRQPPHDELGVRDSLVIGVNRAEGYDQEGNPLYDSVVVVSTDRKTDYTSAGSDLGAVGGLADTEWNLVRDALQRDSSFSNVTVFNSQVSGTMKQQAIVAILLSLLAVVVYIWVRFGSIRYGLAAIAALVHDVSIALGLVALAGLAFQTLGEDSPVVRFLMLDPFKVNLAMIAAFLTIIGYSLNDTIVVFDRIRENRGRLARATPQIINDSINQTISRTVLTSGTTVIAVATLYILGGPGVHGFAFAMLLGIFVGTYSSIAIAAPILLFGYKGGQGPAAGQPNKPAKLSTDEPEIASEPAGA